MTSGGPYPASGVEQDYGQHEIRSAGSVLAESWKPARTEARHPSEDVLLPSNSNNFLPYKSTGASFSGTFASYLLTPFFILGLNSAKTASSFSRAAL